MTTAVELEVYHATDRRVYDGAPCSDMSREFKRTADLDARMKAADPSARCTYFPAEGKFLVATNCDMLNPGHVGAPRILTGNFHEDKQAALIEAILVLEAKPGVNA
jgi:hypothetical protein